MGSQNVGITKPRALSVSNIHYGFDWPSPTDETSFWNKKPKLKQFTSLDDVISLQQTNKDSKLIDIFHVKAEIAPIAKVGGLGDVVSRLARTCVSCGHTVRIMLPFYECIEKDQIKDLIMITMYESYHDGKWVSVNAYRGVVLGVPVIFIEPSNQFFKGDQVYGGSYNELEAYMFFSRACLEWMQVTRTQPDIIHVHEWQAGALPILYWDMYHHLSLKKPRIVLTIHNMEHYGECRQEQLSMSGLDGSLYATFDKGGQMVILGKAPDQQVEREFEELADSVPVVRKTGGLADTVFDVDDESNHELANGFVFGGIDEAPLNMALNRAFACYTNKPEKWECIVKKVMKMDNSWNITAGKYTETYESVAAS